MKNKRRISKNIKLSVGISISFLLTFIMIPVLFVFAITTNDQYDQVNSENIDYFNIKLATDVQKKEEVFHITVYRTETSEFETIEFEQYIIGVVAAEMPALFEMDALRAQAIAARTYALRILEHQDYILDTIMHQVYLDEEQLKLRWLDDFQLHYTTIREAVDSTRGLVLVYDNFLITPMFFAMSSGYTENSEDVFESFRPYLRSVRSSGYEQHISFSMNETFTIEDLKIAFNDPTINSENVIINNLSQGGNVALITIGRESYTGRQVREILGLRSAAFSVNVEADVITFTTYGHGHGVGMSQHGANVMAKNGHSYDEILMHFYQNVEIVRKNLLYSE